MGRGRNLHSLAASASARRVQPASVRVRSASRDDIPALAKLKAEVARRTYEGAHAGPELERWLAENCNEQHYRYRVGRSGYHVLVATDAGGIVGVATMRQRGQRADMSGLYVATPGRGIGRALVRRREELACSLGCVQVRASVWRSNEQGRRFVQAQGLTRKGGYRETTVGVMVDHYQAPLPLRKPLR